MEQQRKGDSMSNINDVAQTADDQRRLRDFRGRVDRAAAIMAAGRPISRALDNCFENYDGKAVAYALYRRAAQRPNTKLAQNIQRYLAGEVNEEARRKAPTMSLEDIYRMAIAEQKRNEKEVAE
jgi:hypothetical protein